MLVQMKTLQKAGEGEGEGEGEREGKGREGKGWEDFFLF